MWGSFGSEPPCSHLLELREFLETNELNIYSEMSESPYGWVSVHCAECHKTYEVTLEKPFEEGED